MAGWHSTSRREKFTDPLSVEDQKHGRTEYDRDLGRVLHSSSFRRLQGKTQVWGTAESDFFRTRLTHSIEAAQIGHALASAYGVNASLVMTACYAHDIGHPPFGHDGADVLNDFATQQSDGDVCFSDNSQNLRIVTSLENAYGLGSGLNLTAATLDGMIKYKVIAKHDKPKSGFYPEDKAIFDWIVKATGTGNRRSPVVMFVELADDIAYACHDLEDGMRAGFISLSNIHCALKEEKTGSASYQLLDLLLQKLQEFSDGKVDQPENFRIAQKRTKSFLVDRFIRRAISLKSEILPKMTDGNYSDDIKANLFFDSAKDLEDEVRVLKKLVRRFIIEDPSVQANRFSSREILRNYLERYKALFGAGFKKDSPECLSLPRAVQHRLENAGGKNQRLRIFLDYVAGMTDSYLIRQAAVFSLGPRPGLADRR